MGLSVISPVAGALICVLSLTILPWQSAPTLLFPQVWQVAFGQSSAHTAADYYVFVVAYPMALFGILLGFAATLESAALRWTTFALSALLLCGGGLLMGSSVLLSTATNQNPGTAGTDTPVQTAVLVGSVLLALSVATCVIALVRGMVGRILCGALLIAYAALHLTMVVSLYASSAATPLPFAFTASLGYLLLAAGAFLGPTYERKSG